MISKGKDGEPEMIGELKQMEVGADGGVLPRDLGVSKGLCITWQAKYGGLDVNERRACVSWRMKITR